MFVECATILARERNDEQMLHFPLLTVAAMNLHVSIASETLFTVGGFPVTNAVATGLIGGIIVVLIFSYVTFMLRRGKYNRFVGLI